MNSRRRRLIELESASNTPLLRRRDDENAQQLVYSGAVDLPHPEVARFEVKQCCGLCESTDCNDVCRHHARSNAPPRDCSRSPE